MKHVDISEVTATAAPVMIRMTRREKLLRWAKLVREYSRQLYLYHRLEYWDSFQLSNPTNLRTVDSMSRQNAFSLAYADPVLAAEGLKGDSIAGVMGFMELTQAQLHEFSCDCGGAIDNDEMARRIEKLAD